MDASEIKEKKIGFLDGSGEMAEMIRNYDWRGSSLGPIEGWPNSLKTTLGIILHSAFPHFFFWGKDLICFYNDAFRPSLGQEGKHPAIGKQGREVWPEIWDFIGPLIHQVMTTGVPVSFEDQLVPFYRNGRVEDIYWTFCYSAAFGDDGSIAGVVVTCTETTEKVKTLKTLSESENRFKFLVQEASVGIVVMIGEELVVKIANEAYGRLIGRTTGEVINRPIFEIIPETESFFRPIIENVLRTGEALQLNEQAYKVTTDGKEIEGYLNLVYQPYKEEGGVITGVMALCQDVTGLVTARQKTEQVVLERTSDLKLANENLERTNSELSQFAYIASHDLQEPLRKITTFSQIIEQRVNHLDEKTKEYVSKVRSSASRMSELVRDVLQFSQLSGTHDVKRAVDLDALVEAVIMDFELVTEQSGAQITKEKLPVVNAIPLHMGQLFNNLVSNALKFTRPGTVPKVHIGAGVVKGSEEKIDSIDKNAEYFRIVVSDNGIGIAKEHEGKVFQIFQRLHGKQDYEGTGIGLAICKKICVNHGGDIYTRPSELGGAAFVVLLPL